LSSEYELRNHIWNALQLTPGHNILDIKMSAIAHAGYILDNRQ